MKPWKSSYLFLLLISGCLVFLSACSTSAIGSSSTPIPSGQTPIITHTPLPATQTSCPAPGTARPAVMSSMTPGSHQNIIYVSETGGAQTVPSQALLMRYDMTTGSKTTILSFTHPDMGITSTQISADGQWILFVALALTENHAKLQLVRIDGQGLQTLFCASLNEIGSIRWSPDLLHVAFTGFAASGHGMAVHLLNLAHAQQEQLVVGNYTPQAWLDNTQLYVTLTQSFQNTSLQHLYLFDTSKGGNQQPASFTRIASANALCGSFEKSSNSTQLFTNSCTPAVLDNCRGYAIQGPSTLDTMPATGGSSRTISSNQNHAMVALHTVNTQTLLIYIQNTGGDFSQNGLWKINTDGSGLTRLTTAAEQQRCAGLEFPAEWPQIISNGQFYALRANESLMAGSLNSGTPTTFETLSIYKGTLNLVGMVII